MEVADRPEIYDGYVAIDYNKVEPHQLAVQAWEAVRGHQKAEIQESIEEIKEAVGQGLVVTDLQEIFTAAREGRGDLLVAHETYNQAAFVHEDFSIELAGDGAEPQLTDDITSTIALEVISKGGRVVFTQNDQIKELGDIVLKTRY